MSEYQYYEFLAIDRPLTSKEMSNLRDLSTRATITPVSFSNEYNWGNFKGDPVKLMQRFFDAHVYIANWMTATFMVRLPIEALSKEIAEAMAKPFILDFDTTKTHWIITWSLEESENYDRFDIEDGHGWMAQLAPIRDELLRGDIRSLYIGWLPAVAMKMVDDEEMEPLAVSGLGALTAAQQSLAQFLDVDKDLLAGAGMDSPALPDEEPLSQEMDKWIDDLPENEVTAILKQLLEGKGRQAERTLKNQFAAWQRSLSDSGTKAPRRKVGELLKNALSAQKIHLEQKKRDQKKREIEQLKKRKTYLKKLSKDFPKAWKAIRQTVERGSGLAYDEACRALVDLSEAHAFHAGRQQFQKDLKNFMADHLRRKALIQRLVKTGIWKDK